VIGKVGSFLGWLALSIAGFFLLCAALAGFEVIGEPEKSRNAMVGLLMLAGMFGIPGAIAVIQRRAVLERQELRQQLIGLIRSHDAISVAELARKIGKTELEAESLLAQLVASSDLDLVFHRSRREYLHRGRIQQAYSFFDLCPSCNARIPAQVVFETETIVCEYCDKPLVAAGT